MNRSLPSSVSSQDSHPLVLVVDDEPRIIRFVRINLEMEGFRVIEASNGVEAVAMVREKMPDIALLDVMMPEMDGFETLRTIREVSSVPVIMLTVRSSEEDKVRGLTSAPMITSLKPFSPRELVSRVRAVLRRFQAVLPTEGSVLTIDEHLAIDYNTAEVIVSGERVKLRPTEFRLLRHLRRMLAGPFPTLTLLSKVWGMSTRMRTIPTTLRELPPQEDRTRSGEPTLHPHSSAGWVPVPRRLRSRDPALVAEGRLDVGYPRCTGQRDPPSGPCSVCSWLPRAGLSNRPQRRSTAVATRSWLWRQSRPRRDLLRPKFCLAHILHASSRSSHSQERK